MAEFVSSLLVPLSWPLAPFAPDPPLRPLVAKILPLPGRYYRLDLATKAEAVRPAADLGSVAQVGLRKGQDLVVLHHRDLVTHSDLHRTNSGHTRQSR